MKIINNEVFASESKYVHRKGNDMYFSKCTLLACETLESFEEVDEIPKSEESELDESNKGTVDRIMNYASVLPSNGEDEPANPYPYPLVAGDEINLMPEFQSKEANEIYK